MIAVRLAGIFIAGLGCVPLAKHLNPWRKSGPDDQVVAIYFYYDLLKFLMIALAGFAIAYLLFRTASLLKSKAAKIIGGSAVILFIGVGIVLLLVFMRRTPSRQPLPTSSSFRVFSAVTSEKNHRVLTRSPVFKASRKDLSEAQQAALKVTFEKKLKPALQEWCRAYAGHLPFQPESLSVDNFINEIGRGNFWMYMFMVNGATFAIAEVNGSAHVSYLNTPEAMKLMSLPNGASINTELSVTRNEITKMLKADSGIDFPPAEIRIIPTAFSSAMNGGVHVNVGGDPNNAASWKYTLVFGPDGNLAYYNRNSSF